MELCVADFCEYWYAVHKRTYFIICHRTQERLNNPNSTSLVVS